MSAGLPHLGLLRHVAVEVDVEASDAGHVQPPLALLLQLVLCLGLHEHLGHMWQHIAHYLHDLTP